MALSRSKPSKKVWLLLLGLLSFFRFHSFLLVAPPEDPRPASAAAATSSSHLLSPSPIIIALDDDADHNNKLIHQQGSMQQHAQLPDTVTSTTSRQQPLVIGLGRGTTGTRTMFSATCALGLPSVHFALSCLPSQQQQQQHQGYQAHRKLHHVFWELFDCLGNTNDGNHRDCPATNEWATRVRREIDFVLFHSSDISAIHDTPYPFVASYLVKRAKQLRGDDNVVVILTERNANDWASRRRNHDTQKLVICRDVEQDFEMQQQGGAEILARDYFDVLECIQRYNRTDGAGGLDAIFMTVRELLRKAHNEDDSILAFAMDGYQKIIQPLASYRVNLFTREMDTKDVAREIQQQTNLSGPYSPSGLKTVRRPFKADKDRFDTA